MVQLDPPLTLGTNVSSLLTHSELLTSAPAGSSRRTGGTGEEKEEEEEEEEEEKVPAMPAGSTVELVDLGLPERGTRSCAYASTLTIHNPRIHSRRAIIRHCPFPPGCRSNIEKNRITKMEILILDQYWSWRWVGKVPNAQCVFWVVRWPSSQMAIAIKTLSHGKTIVLRLFFLYCFRKKALKLVSLFIFRH